MDISAAPSVLAAILESYATAWATLRGQRGSQGRPDHRYPRRYIGVESGGSQHRRPCRRPCHRHNTQLEVRRDTRAVGCQGSDVGSAAPATARARTARAQWQACVWGAANGKIVVCL